MTKFLLLSIEKDKNILISDVYDFLERMDIIANKMYDEIKSKSASNVYYNTYI